MDRVLPLVVSMETHFCSRDVKSRYVYGNCCCCVVSDVSSDDNGWFCLLMLNAFWKEYEYRANVIHTVINRNDFIVNTALRYV